MNIDEILQTVQDLRSQLDAWGVTSNGLLFEGAIAILLFILSLREVLTWYMRVTQVRDEVRQLRAQMALMQKTMLETQELIARQLGAEVTKPLTSDELLSSAKTIRPQDSKTDSNPTKFLFDH